MERGRADETERRTTQVAPRNNQYTLLANCMSDIPVHNRPSPRDVVSVHAFAT